MGKNVIFTPKAPRAIGPYSQAIRYGDLLFVSGQIPVDPATGQVVPGGVAEQTTQVLENLGAVLEAGGLSYAQILKTTIYLENLDDFKTVNELYGARFAGDFPARATVQVARLPLGVKVEIDAIAGA